MKLSKSTLVVPLAGLLLIGAAGAVAAASSGADATSSTGIVPAAPSASPGSGTTERPDRDGMLTEVLADLVADGTITAAQQTAITEALDAAWTARREDAQARMEQLRTFLEDGVISQQEFDQLPEDSRLRQLTTLMDDGQITSDELRSLGRGLRGGHGGLGPRVPRRLRRRPAE